MSQLNYNFLPAVAFAGLKADNRDGVVESYIAGEDLDFGLAVVAMQAASKAKSVRRICRNQSAIVFSADLVTSNTINLTANGVAITQVTFASTHAATMAAVGAAIVATLAALTVPIVAVATVGGASNRTLTIVATDASIVIASVVVAAGSSQATAAVTASSVDLLRGLTLHSQKGVTGLGVGGVFKLQAVNVERRSRIWVTTSASVKNGDDVYVDTAAGKESMLTNVPTNNLYTGGKFRGVADGSSTPTIVEVEINLPYGT